MNNNNFNRDELYHYGVKGMKWGHRRNRNVGGSDNASGQKRYTTSRDVAAAKKAMKSAAKDYTKSYNKAYNRSLAALSPSRKQREANDKRWSEAFDKGSKYYEAKIKYKETKRSYKRAVKEESKRILEGESFVGRLYDRLTDAHKTQARFNIEWQDYDD